MPRGENLRIARDAYVRAFPRLLVSMRMIDEAGNELPDANYYINLRHPRRRDEAPRTNETKRSQWIVDGEYRYIEINWECALWWTRTAFWLYVPLNQNANGQNIVQHRRVRLGARKVFLRPHITVLHRELLEENYNAVNCVYFFDVHWWAFNIPLEAPVEPEARIRMYLRWPNPQDSAPVSPGKRHTVPGTQVTEKRSVTTGHASSGVAVNCSVEYRSNHVSTQTTVTMCGMP